MGDSYLGMLHNDPYSDYNYYSSQLYVPAERTNSTNKKTIIHAIICRGNIFDRSGLLRSHVAFPANSVHAMVFISVWLTLVVNKYSCVSQCAHTWQIKNLAETNFVEIFGRTKQILSVQCVRTHNSLHLVKIWAQLILWAAAAKIRKRLIFTDMHS